MKKIVLALALVLSFFGMKAAPVSLEEARALAQNFVENTFESTRMGGDATLVYSTPSFYVFNIGQNGFVILSADDSYRPVIGYSYQGAFDPTNMAPALEEYLNNINEYRTYRGSVNADAMAASDWESLRAYGRLVSRYGGRDAEYLVETQWNQNYPYNYFCPEDSNGPGGHCYAGCVATAAGQVMKYWNHPLQGTGSYTYTPGDNPQYGPQTANFGATTYDWENMPNSINSDSPIEQIEAVGTLLYHCGVAVDMNYRPSGSGAQTIKLCTVMPQYFNYTSHMENIYRSDYSKEAYLELLFKSIDKNWPMANRGGGHAYVFDGYDDAGLVHINWGWSGSSDGFFDIDGHNYTDGQSVIYNYVPAEVYNSTPDVPTNLTMTADNNELSVTVSWNNPTKTLTNENLISIDRVVVMRNNVVVHTADNAAPGTAMTFVDNVPCFDAYEYKIYAVSNGLIGETAKSDLFIAGPTCQWKFILSSQNMLGWKNASIKLYNTAGTMFKKVTLSSSTPVSVDVDIPLGNVNMEWDIADVTQSYDITIMIKNSQNTTVFSYSGSIQDMTTGVFLYANNGCGNEAPTESPSDLYTNSDGDNIILTWNGVSEKDGYGYNIFRDGQLIRLTNANEYVDENPGLGGHCYEVSYLGLGGESGRSNEACGNVGEGCDTGSNLWYGIQTTNDKPIITWEAPENATGLSAYYIYRKVNADGEYEMIKMVNSNKTEYKETKQMEYGNFYYYKVVPYYHSIECFAAPIKARYGNTYYVRFLYAHEGVNDINTNGISVYPNPTNGNLRIEAEALNNVAVFNLVGQKVYEENISGDECVINMREFGIGIYIVKIQAANGSTTQKVTVIE